MPPTLYIAHSQGDNLPAADWNDNFQMVEEALLDLGPYVIAGLVPSAGAGLAVNVTSGTASIGGRVTFSAFSIGSLAPSTLNHLYVLNDGTGTSNTTGTAPANSAKLGTATTGVATVSSVDTTPTSGRQAKVDLTTVVSASNANAFTAAQTITLNDTSSAAVTRPLILRHSHSAGVGAIGIGAGIDLQIETATEGTFNTIGRIDARSTAVVAGAATGALDISLPSAGTMAVRMTIDPTSLSLGSGMTLNTNGGQLSAGAGRFSGTIGGSGLTAFSIKRHSLTFPSD